MPIYVGGRIWNKKAKVFLMRGFSDEDGGEWNYYFDNFWK
jgi:hypothetical protein